MRKGFLLTAFLFSYYIVFAQPYVDIINVRYMPSPDNGLFRRNQTANSYQYFDVDLTLPIQFKKSGTVLVFSPSFENWQATLDDSRTMFPSGIALPVTLLTPLKNKKFLLNTTAIVRNNGENFSLPNTFQAGGLFLLNYKVNDKLTVKGGLYYNREAFGNFFMPLGGIDYKPDSTLNIWGTLPGSFFIEKRFKKWLYAGVTFKAVTSSYQLFGLHYLHINDNQLSLFTDVYLTKNFVLNAEAGHSILRRLRIGNTGKIKDYSFDAKSNDNYLFRISAAYRIRM